MPRSPQVFFSFIALILILTLTGCQLSRDSTSDPGAVGEQPTPTLTSLGAEESGIPLEATPIPTIINVQPTATGETMMGAGEAAENPGELVAPTVETVNLIGVTPATGNQTGNVSAAGVVSPETFVPPAEKASVDDTPVIVNATSTQLPDGGPVAANPPASQANNYNDNPVTYGESTYVVQTGDTLFSISTRYGTTVEAFMYANNMTTDMIYEGQTLNIPSGDGSAYAAPPVDYNQAPPAGNDYNNGYHTVAMGETLFGIAQWYNTSVEAMATANGLSYPYVIYEGQNLIIPAYGAAPPANPGYYQQPETYPQAPADGYYPPQETYPAPSGIAGTHTVAPGETLFSIAQRYGTTAQAISMANGIANPNQIYVGQVLYLP